MQIQSLKAFAKSDFSLSHLTTGSNVPLFAIQCIAVSSLPLLFCLQLRVNTDNKGNTTPGYFTTPVLQILPKEQMGGPFMLL